MMEEAGRSSSPQRREAGWRYSRKIRKKRIYEVGDKKEEDEDDISAHQDIRDGLLFRKPGLVKYEAKVG
jgi:hypothetical protein